MPHGHRSALAPYMRISTAARRETYSEELRHEFDVQDSTHALRMDHAVAPSRGAVHITQMPLLYKNTKWDRERS